MLRVLICALALVVCDTASAATAGPGACAPLGPPSGRVIDVGPAQADRLPSIVRDAPAGATVRLRAGRYRVRDAVGLSLARPGVSLRSRSGDPRDVVIDGAYGPSELLRVAASGITVGEVTLTRARDHLVHAFPPEGRGSIERLRLYRVRLVDSGEQFVKANPNASTHRPRPPLAGRVLQLPDDGARAPQHRARLRLLHGRHRRPWSAPLARAAQPLPGHLLRRRRGGRARCPLLAPREPHARREQPDRELRARHRLRADRGRERRPHARGHPPQRDRRRHPSVRHRDRARERRRRARAPQHDRGDRPRRPRVQLARRALSAELGARGEQPGRPDHVPRRRERPAARQHRRLPAELAARACARRRPPPPRRGRDRRRRDGRPAQDATSTAQRARAAGPTSAPTSAAPKTLTSSSRQMPPGTGRASRSVPPWACRSGWGSRTGRAGRSRSRRSARSAPR